MARLTKAARLPQIEDVPTVGRCLESFLLALDAAGRAKETLDGYREAVLQCSAFLDNPVVSEVRPDDLRRFLIALRDAGRKPSTQRTRHQALTRFFGWAETEGLIERSPMHSVEAPTVPDVEPPGFAADELRALLDACDTRSTLGARDRALFLTLLDTALRAGELLQLRMDDVIRESLTVHYLRVLGKGRRERIVTLGRTAREAIALWLLRRGEDDDPHLWIGEKGPLSLSGVEQICIRRGRKAGVANCHPHRFRNTALAAMLDAGMDRGQVMKIAGHRSEMMIRRYTGYSEERRANDAKLAAGHVERLVGDGKDGRGKRRAKA